MTMVMLLVVSQDLFSVYSWRILSQEVFGALFQGTEIRVVLIDVWAYGQRVARDADLFKWNKPRVKFSYSAT